MTSVLIISDVRLYRDGLAELLGRYAHRVTLVGVASGLCEALPHLESSRPDVALIDLAMPDAFSAITTVRQRLHTVCVIALGVPEVEVAVVDCACAGAAGYVSRSGSVEELMTAIASAERQEFPCSPKVAAKLVERLRTSAGPGENELASTPLTRRELAVVRLIDEGLSNKQIAARLNIQTSTVKNHVHNALDKLHAGRRGEAVAKLRHAGVLAAADVRNRQLVAGRDRDSAEQRVT